MVSSSSNLLSSATSNGMTTPININGNPFSSNHPQHSPTPIVSMTSPSTSQTRLPFPQRPTITMSDPSHQVRVTTASQPSQQEQFSKILALLQQYNMKESEETFKKEYQSFLNKSSSVSSFSEPYFTALDGYIAYVQEQPTTSRHEFAQLIYPLFVHMYLDLIEKDHSDEAQAFFRTYVSNTNLQATVFAAHTDDLYRIKSLLTKEQIAQSEYVKSFRHNGRYWIKLCNASLELLDQFLIKQQKYPLLTKIVQAYFQVTSRSCL